MSLQEMSRISGISDATLLQFRLKRNEGLNGVIEQFTITGQSCGYGLTQ